MEKGNNADPKHRRFNKWAVVGVVGAVLVGASIIWLANSQKPAPPEAGHPARQDIATTVFWVGEGADESNRNIHNRSSTWTEDWVGAFGGVDDPESRCDLLPCGFTPKENAFYFALPYNDLDENCQAKRSQQQVPWFTQSPPEGESVIKNRWIKIDFEGKTAFAQWEDAGPYGEDDTGYVFGDSPPAAEVGLDVSPATAEFLGIDGHDQTSWQFVEEKDVPDGPWRQTITRTPPDCAR